ncbi:MAG: transporter substrate-binding domain-containing protein [Colwellia sp.]|nr:transporter substrate-binding domain-containing protein [Colwellia sp.]
MFNFIIRVLILSYFGFIGVCYTQETIKIAVTDWPPYYSKTDRNGGQQLELLQSVFNELNLQLTPVWYRTGVGALVKVKAGLLDGAAGWECNKERAVDFVFSDPIGFEQTTFFHHKDFDFDWSHFENPDREIIIGITARYAYGDELQKLLAIDKVKVEIAGTDRRNLDLLFHREIDLFLLDKLSGLALINQAHEPLKSQLVAHSTPFRHTKVAIRLLVPRAKPNAQQFVDQFNHALREVIKQKKLAHLSPMLFTNCPS